MVASVSSGVETLPALVYYRNFFKPTEGGERVLERELVVEEAFNRYPREIVQSAIDVPLKGHFEMQKIVQKHIDNAVSKTINMAEDADIEEFGKIWLEYLPYLKGTTVYRFGSRENEPINPVPRDQWDEVVGHEESHSQMTVDEFMDLDCPGGVCEVPQKWQEGVAV
jgi:ribonucleotide reductase alpha subunit